MLLYEIFLLALLKQALGLLTLIHIACPVDGTVLRFGELKESGAMIEQVKGFSYSAYSLLGASSILTSVPDIFETDDEYKKSAQNRSKRSWWRVSLASPQVREPTPTGQMKGRLMPLNERATRTIKNLYVENERVVLEGQWSEGFFALAAIGATNIGSIELSIEPELRTNKWKKLLTLSEPPQERVYEPEGVGVMLKKGEEVATFNMGSTVVLVFQAPISKSKQEDIEGNGNLSEFNFSVKRGDRVRMGEALGRWSRD